MRRVSRKTMANAIHLAPLIAEWRGTRTPAQLKFQKTWGPMPTVRSSEEAVKWLIGSCRATAGPP